MRINQLRTYGAAGGTERLGEITLHVRASDCDTVAQADSLFRAAPDLLAALSELLAESDEFHNPHTEGWNMARLAIAKATGNLA
jgi:hypothetical protein